MVQQVNLTEFGTKDTLQYIAFSNLEKASADFNDTATQVIKLPGADGGLNSFGTGRSPQAVGKVQATFYLTSDDGINMVAQRDLVKTMKSWGQKRLFMRPADPLLPRRWCFATVQSIDMDEDAGQGTEFLQPVTVTWLVTDPFWYTAGNELIWGDFVWGDGSIWGGSAGVSVTDTYSLDITYRGTAPTYVRVTIRNDSAVNVGSPVVTREFMGEQLDRWAWGGDIPPASRLEVDPRLNRVLLDENDRSDLFTYSSAEWLMLNPGVNTIRVFLDGTATVWIRYMERWF